MSVNDTSRIVIDDARVTLQMRNVTQLKGNKLAAVFKAKLKFVDFFT
jgi:hypothetical protein